MIYKRLITAYQIQ